MEAYPNLREEMKRQDVSQNDLAKLLGVSLSTINNKINKRNDFLLSEAVLIKQKYFASRELEWLFESGGCI